MLNKKHMVLTAVTLGAIAACSAALIGLANFFTRDAIEKNKEKRFNAGITAIFGENSEAHEFSDLSELDLLDKAYSVHKDDVTTGWAIVATGSNMYGKISLIAGFDYSSKLFVGTYLITNEQTYASTLVENYVTPLNNDDGFSIDDVSCGATYGAKLVRDLINAAQSYVDGIIYD